ncbi:MAG: aminotransferase [Planctomycetota bacterium]|jgi:aminotransferase
MQRPQTLLLRHMPLDRSQRLAGFVQSDIRAMTRECERVGGINLGQGICDLPTPPAVAKAAIAAIEGGRSIYSYPEGIVELREKVALKLARQNGIVVDPATQILISAGSAGAFTAVLHGLLDPGDGLLLMEPYYGYHKGAARIAGIEPQTLTLEMPGFRLTESALRSSIRANTKAIVVCTPGNPSGRMFDREELLMLARVAEEHDLLVITDEIYEEIRYDDRVHLCPASLPELADRCVTIMGLSKTFSITGWRLGYAVASPERLRSMTLVHDLFYICAPTPLQYGVCAGFDEPPAFFESMRADYAKKRELLCSTLERVGLSPNWPEGAYYVLADCRKLGQSSSKEAALELLRRTGVASIPGSAFYEGDGGEHLLRFCFAKQDSELEAAVERLANL